MLYNAARKKSPILWYDSASLASNDEQRFKDGVILADEPVQFIINAFDELVEEESLYPQERRKSMKEYYFNGEKYIFSNGVWLTPNHLAVPTALQGELNKSLLDTMDFSACSVSEILTIIDKSRAEKNNIQLAEKLLKIALSKANENEIRLVLPRATSNLRLLGQPSNAIKLSDDYLERFGKGIISPALFTSIGAAYCDLEDYEQARVYAGKAYGLGGKGNPELRELYQRLERLENPSDTAYDRKIKREEYFDSHPRSFGSSKKNEIHITDDIISEEESDSDSLVEGSFAPSSESEDEQLEQLVKSYIHLLSSNENAKKRFQTLVEWVREDCKRLESNNLEEKDELETVTSSNLLKKDDADEVPLKNDLTAEEKKLFENLRKLRMDLAKEAKLPPYYIFTDKSLAEMSKQCPGNQEEMLSINGVGKAKYDKYGKLFLEAIQKYLVEDN